MSKPLLIISMWLAASIAFGQAKLDQSLVAVLDTILYHDQANRLKSDSLQKIYGWESVEMRSLWEKINHEDSVNLVKVKEIIDTHGWLGPDVVGQRGSQTIFLVIQHADSLTQVTYLPMLREAVNQGKARPLDLAMLEDRVLMKQGKPQIYGSQVIINQSGGYEFYSIKDEANVNKRRASVGLEPIEEYAKHFEIEYVAPKGKRKK